MARRRRAHRALHRRALLERRTRQSFVSTAGGDALDASLLLLAELGFVAPDDPRFAGDRATPIERELKRGDFVFRYVERDDFGEPENAFVVCTFWYVNALAALGRRDEARALFERLLACRNRARPARRAPRPRAPASSGATSCRPTAWSGSSPRRSACRCRWDAGVLSARSRSDRAPHRPFRASPRSSPRRAPPPPARPTRRPVRRR